MLNTNCSLGLCSYPPTPSSLFLFLGGSSFQSFQLILSEMILTFLKNTVGCSLVFEFEVIFTNSLMWKVRFLSLSHAPHCPHTGAYHLPAILPVTHSFR